MNLTQDDLNAIREVLKEEVTITIRSVIKQELEPISGELEALRNDMKEIYGMLADLQSKSLPDKQFEKLTIEQKLLKLNAKLLAAAKQAGITLPRG